MNSSVVKRDTYTYDMEIDREDNVYLIGTTFSDGLKDLMLLKCLAMNH